MFKKAKQLEPCVLVFDQIDSIAPKRDNDEDSQGNNSRALSQLLTEMDGIASRKNVFIVGCTNHIDMLDDAVKRPGRLDQHIFVDYPSTEDRIAILKNIMKHMPLEQDVLGMEHVIAQETQQWSGAKLSALCREAALYALRADLNASSVSRLHFEKALQSKNQL